MHYVKCHDFAGYYWIVAKSEDRDACYELQQTIAKTIALIQTNEQMLALLKLLKSKYIVTELECYTAYAHGGK